MSQQTKANRIPLPDTLWEMRGEAVKWPTLRKAWLNNGSVENLRTWATQVGRSIIFLDGQYRTNLNQWCKPPVSPIERAVFFEFLIKHHNIKGGIFALCWIGNFHNGSIFHCAWQYPQVKCWERVGSESAEKFFERKAFYIYSQMASIMYANSEHDMDKEVEDFITQNER